MRNATTRINTGYFYYLTKKSPHGYGIIELQETKKPFTQKRSYSDTMIPHKQLFGAGVFEDYQNIFEENKPQFLALLEQHINIDKIIPITFLNHFYASTGRTRKYSLHALLWALIIQLIFSIPTDQLLLTFLHYSKPLRDFFGFTKVPDASKITRLKQNFIKDLQSVFDKLVDITELICQDMDSFKADRTIFDSSGIEAFGHRK